MGDRAELFSDRSGHAIGIGHGCLAAPEITGAVADFMQREASMEFLEPVVRSIADMIGIATAVLTAIGTYYMLRMKVGQSAERIEQLSRRQDKAEEEREKLRQYVIDGYVRRDFLDKVEANLSERIKELELTVRSSASETLMELKAIIRDMSPWRG
jgi:FtsZ-binding cell division protein ZapB